MKFEDFLMQRSREKQKRVDLEKEVAILQAELDDEQKLNRVLQYALHGQIVSHPSFSSLLLPPQVQVLFAELKMVEKEIILLERRVEELNLCLDQENNLKRERQLQLLQQHQWIQKQQKHYYSGVDSHKNQDHEQSVHILHNKAGLGGQKLIRERTDSLGSASEIHAMSSGRLNGDVPQSSEGYGGTETAGKSRCHGGNQTKNLLDDAMDIEKPNKVSEELIICLTGIFLTLNQSSAHLNSEGSASIPKLALSYVNSKGQKSKTSFICKAPKCFLDDNTSILYPYATLSGFDCPVSNIGPYKNFIQFTRNSVDMSRVSECLPAIRKMRLFLHLHTPSNEQLGLEINNHTAKYFYNR